MIPIARLTPGLLALLLADSAAAQAIYPEKPVRLIVSRPPGSQPDIVGRLVGQKFSEAWGKPVHPFTARDGTLYLTDDTAGVIYRIVRTAS